MPAGDEEAAMDREECLELARADAAQFSGVDIEDVVVVSYDDVTWRDGSLGCPRPGLMYTQALVEGYRIVLRVGGRELHYHGRRGAQSFRCDRPNPRGAFRDVV
ncbi:hypothetical protein [Microbacterium candidum]|uniref:Uncharacterized protein n=1 Tax=Microbacterium candidum TaxID=3041922 RepID=A0ABT7MYF2_9MICO|nr:hypothetical protein [Microbacterium sp. ASV49]MDL9979478.1 hypothetical protein [Microbacterium sp. ASV49]